MKYKIEYYKCYKCGAILEQVSGRKIAITCTQPNIHRTSGLCGGAFTIKVTKQDYENMCQVEKGKI